MSYLTILLVLLVGLEHIYIMVLEVFLLDTAGARKNFNITEHELFNKNIRVLFLNQGFYNLVIAIGIFISLFFLQDQSRIIMLYFFLGSVIFLSIVGASSSSKMILIKQGGPALLALISLIFLGV